MKKIGIFGGTFSPPHKGHVRSAELFAAQRQLDELHILPAGIPPHKESDGQATAEDRLAMCRLAFGHIPGVTVSDREIRREGKSYTVLTLREYAEMGIHPEMLVGTDMLLCLDRWYCFREILSLATVVCMRRESDADTGHLLLEKAEALRADYGAKIVFLDGDALELSSSAVRASLSDRHALLPPSVVDYIEKRGLYGIL